MKTSRDPDRLARQASERLRQERETFNQRRGQCERWFKLKLAMGYISILILSGIFFVAATILLHQNRYPANVVAAASIALFTDALGLAITIWKIVLHPGPTSKLEPVTGKPLDKNLAIPRRNGLRKVQPEIKARTSGTSAAGENSRRTEDTRPERSNTNTSDDLVSKD